MGSLTYASIAVASSMLHLDRLTPVASPGQRLHRGTGKLNMVIQIERISAQSIRRCDYHCVEPYCTATATWSLVDRGMPETHVANLGERPCCIEHIVATYLSLRGAHLVASMPPAARLSDIRAGVDRRRRRKRRSIASGIESGMLARGTG